MRIANVLERGRRQFGSSPCVAHVSDETIRVLTYDDAWLALKEHQQWLERTIPENDGQEVVLAYLSSNSTDMMISLLASSSSSSTSMTVSLLNTRWTCSEMAAALQTDAPVIVLYSADFRTKALETQAKLIQQSQEAVAVELPLLSLPYLTSHWSDTRRPVSRTNESIDSDIQQASSFSQQEDALIVFTSGTTSGSKGVRLSHGALWIQALAKLRHPCRYSQTTRMLSSTVPLFHVGGLSSLLALWLAGGTWMVVANTTTGGSASSFDPPTVFQAVSHPTFATNTLVVVPAMLHALLHENKNQAVYPHVELLFIGGQSASPSMLVQLQQVFPHARIVQTYACTEAASSMTFFEPDNTKKLPALPDGVMGDCVGRPPPHVELVVLVQNNNNGHKMITTPYKVGVLATRGPHVMSGYWKRNESSMRNNGWFITHDLAFQDVDGRYYMCGRAKDVIRTGGETVIALEVERILLQHTAIVECAVFALPDDRFGEAVCAAIVVSSNPPLSLQDVRQHCAGLAGYKRPRRLFHVNALPRNSSGKVVKHELVKQFKIPQSKL